MITLYPTQQPPQTQALMGGDGAPLQLFYYFLRALFLRTGGAGGVMNTVATAATGSLTADYNVVASGAAVTLANLQPGQQQWVRNTTGGGLTVNPFGSGQIDGGASYSLADNKTQIFTCESLLGNGSPSYSSTQLG